MGKCSGLPAATVAEWLHLAAASLSLNVPQRPVRHYVVANKEATSAALLKSWDRLYILVLCS